MLDEAEEFLGDRGLLTRTADSPLPSMFEACHEEPYAREKRGFGQWPASTFPWFGQLGACGYLTLGVDRSKSLLVTAEVADVVDPICRAELARMEKADEHWGRLLRHLADAGPSDLDDLQTELTLTPKELKSLRSPLERCGAVVALAVVHDEPDRHTSLLARWDQAHPVPSGASDPRQAHGDLVCAGASLPSSLRKRELSRWFPGTDSCESTAR